MTGLSMVTLGHRGMRGGASTGPKTAEGIPRIRRAHTRHGKYSAELVQLRRALAADLRLTKEPVGKV